MLRLGVFVGPVIIGLWIFCVVDVLLSREDRTRNLPKFGWLLLVLFFPLVGSVAWLIAGRPGPAPRRNGPLPAYPEYDRPGRMPAPTPESDEEFLRRCRERAEAQRRAYRDKQAGPSSEQGDPDGSPTP